MERAPVRRSSFYGIFRRTGSKSSREHRAVSEKPSRVQKGRSSRNVLGQNRNKMKGTEERAITAKERQSSRRASTKAVQSGRGGAAGQQRKKPEKRHGPQGGGHQQRRQQQGVIRQLPHQQDPGLHPQQKSQNQKGQPQHGGLPKPAPQLPEKRRRRREIGVLLPLQQNRVKSGDGSPGGDHRQTAQQAAHVQHHQHGRLAHKGHKRGGIPQKIENTLPK